MNFYIIFAIVLFSTLGIVSTNNVFAQVDPLSGIEFLQTGKLNTEKDQFQISNDINIREFFAGKIIRVSGHTVEGFPYIVYSKILDEKIDTKGTIFINGEFIDLMFEKKSTQDEKDIEKEEILEKKDDVAIVVQYTDRVYSKNYANISMYVFDKEQNKLNVYNQKDGRIPNTDIEITVLDGDDELFYSSNGISSKFGFYETKFWIPDNYKRSEFSVTIDAENENSKSSKILQLFTLGNDKKSSTASCPEGTSLDENGNCL